MRTKIPVTLQRKINATPVMVWQAAVKLQLTLLSLAGAVFFPVIFFRGHFTHTKIWTIGPFCYGADHFVIRVPWHDQNSLLAFWTVMMAFNLGSLMNKKPSRFAFHLWGMALIIGLFMEFCLVAHGAFGGKDFGGAGPLTYSFIVGICFILYLGVHNYFAIILMQRKFDKKLLPLVGVATIMVVAAADGTANKEKDASIVNAGTTYVADGRPPEKEAEVKFSSLNMVD